VLFNLANQYAANDMDNEALSTYNVIIKTKDFNNSGITPPCYLLVHSHFTSPCELTRVSHTRACAEASIMYWSNVLPQR